MQELKQVLYDENNEMLPIDAPNEQGAFGNKKLTKT